MLSLLLIKLYMCNLDHFALEGAHFDQFHQIHSVYQCLILERLTDTYECTTWMKEDINFFKDASVNVLFWRMSSDLG